MHRIRFYPAYPILSIHVKTGMWAGFDLVTLVDKPHYDNMRELHDALMAIYGSEDAVTAPP